MRWGLSVACLLACLCMSRIGSAGQAAMLDAPDTIYRGQPFFVKVVSWSQLMGIQVHWRGKTVRLPAVSVGDHDEAVALLGLGLGKSVADQPLTVRLETAQGVQMLEKRLRVRQYDYPSEHIQVAAGYVTLSASNEARDTRERKQIRAVLDRITPGPQWCCPFVRPVPGAAKSVFGLRRFFNGQERSPHRGIDLQAAQGEPVAACCAGRVALAGNHYFSGNSVYIDHGQGVVSMYVHLSEIRVTEGQAVAAGDIVGLVGKTGRATGPHLHFGLSVLGDSVDPAPLLSGSCRSIEE